MTREAGRWSWLVTGLTGDEPDLLGHGAWGQVVEPELPGGVGGGRWRLVLDGPCPVLDRHDDIGERGLARVRGWSRSRFRGQLLDRAKVGPGGGRLIGQVAIQGFEARVGEVEGREPVVAVPPDGTWDVLWF